MVQELTWKFGGRQGEGIELAGEVFARTLNRLGYHLYGYRFFTSRIKGGHTNNRLRISIEAVATLSDALDLLVAIDQETIDFNRWELRPGGLLIADSAFNPLLPEGVPVELVTLPLTALATECGGAVMKNLVAIGVSLAVLGLDLASGEVIVRSGLAAKGEKVVSSNLAALRRGWEAMHALLPAGRDDLRLAPADGGRRLLMVGNEAIALGALAAGCRFMAAYPITPSSEIMEYLIEKLPHFGGAVIQSEDEIAACSLAIGANYAGVRAMTASSGPGLSLMAEAIGLAGMTETPLVVIDSQRGGPSTGLPTKHEQSDLLAMIYGTHGEAPKIVMAPGNAEEAFYDIIEAFNLAEEYQCPVIFLCDLQLSLALQTLPFLDYARIAIRRGKLELHPKPSAEQPFKRFAVTADGISPRILPGTKGQIFHVTGIEHNEKGRPLEAAANRTLQMDKRRRKLAGLIFPDPVRCAQRHARPELLLLGFNSTQGAIAEACARLNADGFQVDCAQVRLLHPFPTASLAPLVAAAQRVAVVEHNASGQLAALLHMHLGREKKIASIRKYDGNPFYPGEIEAQAREVLNDGNG